MNIKHGKVEFWKWTLELFRIYIHSGCLRNPLSALALEAAAMPFSLPLWGGQVVPAPKARVLDRYVPSPSCVSAIRLLSDVLSAFGNCVSMACCITLSLNFVEVVHCVWISCSKQFILNLIGTLTEKRNEQESI